MSQKSIRVMVVLSALTAGTVLLTASSPITGTAGPGTPARVVSRPASAGVSAPAAPAPHQTPAPAPGGISKAQPVSPAPAPMTPPAPAPASAAAGTAPPLTRSQPAAAPTGPRKQLSILFTSNVLGETDPCG